MEGLFEFPELSWLCIGMTTSAITCNPLLNYCLIVPMYILYHWGESIDVFPHLMGLFAGMGLGLWLRKTEKWTPYWAGDLILQIPHLFFYALVTFVVRRNILFTLATAGVATSPGERFHKIIMIQCILLAVWTVWSIYLPNYFRPFYRVYILVVLPMALLISDSAKQEKK